MVGAGAIGCELLKNFAMLGLGTCAETKSKIYVTDPDIIEVSNLNRQFLFREKHIRMPKSVTASAAIKLMSPGINCLPLTEKVCPQTEDIFTDSLLINLDIIVNALDNVQARKYIDNRCVRVNRPLLESGTLGPKGHVQVIIPSMTENYGAMTDPDDDGEIPYCTLKMFPEETVHCVEWGRDKFEKLFNSEFKTLETCVFEYESSNFNINSLLKIEIKQLLTAIK
jgi:molybdopterin/thiamine biosynthesis adenylyltransferase